MCSFVVHYFRITSTYLYSFQFAGRRCHLRLQKLEHEDIRTEAHTRREALLPVFLVETLLITVSGPQCSVWHKHIDSCLVPLYFTATFEIYSIKQISILF